MTTDEELRLLRDALRDETRKREHAEERNKTLMDAMDFAWCIIANAQGGDWDHPCCGDGWKAAAERWRDDFWHPAIGVNRKKVVSP